MLGRKKFLLLHSDNLIHHAVWSDLIDSDHCHRILIKMLLNPDWRTEMHDITFFSPTSNQWEKRGWKHTRRRLSCEVTTTVCSCRPRRSPKIYFLRHRSTAVYHTATQDFTSLSPSFYPPSLWSTRYKVISKDCACIDRPMQRFSRIRSFAGGRTFFWFWSRGCIFVQHVQGAAVPVFQMKCFWGFFILGIRFLYEMEKEKINTTLMSA